MEKSIFIPCVCAVHFPFVPSPDLSDFHFVLLCPGPTLPERYGLPIPVRNFDWLSFTPPPLVVFSGPSIGIRAGLVTSWL
jgi:hypothetical protein